LPSGLREVISNMSSKRVTREEVAVAIMTRCLIVAEEVE
jgi:hypothetical protein